MKPQINALLKRADELAAAFQSNPFEALRATAIGVRSTAKAVLDGLENNPERPADEAVKLREIASRSIEMAEIVFKCVDSEYRAFMDLVESQIVELGGGARTLVSTARQDIERKIENALCELVGGSFPESSMDSSEFIFIAKHPGRHLLLMHERSLAARDATGLEMIERIRRAMAACTTHLASTPQSDHP